MLCDVGAANLSKEQVAGIRDADKKDFKKADLEEMDTQRVLSQWVAQLSQWLPQTTD